MIIYSSMVNWQKMKMRKRVYHQQINSYQSLGKLLESTIFRLSKMCIESKSSDIHNPYYMSVSFLTWERLFWRYSYGQSYCMEIWVRMLESISLKVINRWNNKLAHWTFFSLENIGPNKLRKIFRCVSTSKKTTISALLFNGSLLINSPRMLI